MMFAKCSDDQETHFSHTFGSLASMQEQGVFCDITLLQVSVIPTSTSAVSPSSSIASDFTEDETGAKGAITSETSDGRIIVIDLEDREVTDGVHNVVLDMSVGTAATKERGACNAVDVPKLDLSKTADRKTSEPACTSSDAHEAGYIISGDIRQPGSSTQGHKVVLAACSRVLRSLLMADPHITELPVIGFSAETIAALVGYMYGKQLPLTPDNVSAMLAACHAWGMDDAVRICTRFKIKNVVKSSRREGKTRKDVGAAKCGKKRAGKVRQPSVKTEPGKLHVVVPKEESDGAEVNESHSGKGAPPSDCRIHGLRQQKRRRYGQVAEGKAPKKANVKLENVTVLKPKATATRKKSKRVGVSKRHGFHADYLDLSVFYDDNKDENELIKSLLEQGPSGDTTPVVADTEAVIDDATTNTETQKEEKRNDQKNRDTKSNMEVNTQPTHCRNCGKNFPTWREFRRHRLTCSVKARRSADTKQTKPYACNQCTFHCQVETRLVEHMYRQHGYPLANSGFEVYVCEAKGCGYQSILRNVMKHHQTKHSEERPYMCELCGAKFKSRMTLRTHSYMHTNTRAFKCEYCDNAYIQRVGLYNHVKSKHEKSNDFLCSQCPFVTNLKPNLQNHMFSVHGVLQNSRTKVYECEYCGLKTLRKSEYVNHMQRHTGVKNYSCDICGHKFITVAEVNSHRKRHNDSAPKNVCPHEGCNFAVFEKSKLNQHIRIRHLQKGAKPWLCYVCDYKTDLKGNLTKHLRTVHQLKVATNQRLCKVVNTAEPTPVVSLQQPDHVNVNDLYMAKPPPTADVPDKVVSTVDLQPEHTYEPLPSNAIDQVLMRSTSQPVSAVDTPIMTTLCDVAPLTPEMALSHTLTTSSVVPSQSIVTNLPEVPVEIPSFTPLMTHVPGPVRAVPSTYADGQLAPFPVMQSMLDASEGNLYMYAADGQIVPAQSIPWEHTYDMAQFRQNYK